MRQILLLILVFDIPAVSVWDDAGNGGIELANWVNFALFSEALDVLLHLFATRVFVHKILILFITKAWEFVQLTWHLHSRVCSIVAPNTTNIGLRFEKGAVNAQILETVYSLEASNTSADNADLLDVSHCSGKGAPLL